MKNTLIHLTQNRHFWLLLLLQISVASSHAQSPYAIEAKALYDGNNVILRWAPKDFDTWHWANFNNGYDVERTTLELNGAPLSRQDVLASKVTLASSLKPLPEAQWENMADTTNAGIVAGSIYGDSIEVLDLGNADFMSVVNTNEARQNRFGFSLFACDQNLDVALAAGLAFFDTSVVAQARYLYTIKLHTLPNGATQKQGVAFVKTNAENLPKPAKPIAVGRDKVVLLSWTKQADYGSYEVERSADNGATYLVLNTKPFVNLTQGAETNVQCAYMDSLAANNVSYVYRVRGMTPFGISGPPSDTVQAGGVPAPLAESPFIDQLSFGQNGQINLHWQYPVNMENLITVFEVHRAATIDGESTMLGSVQPNVRVYSDPSPLGVNYYTIWAKDLNGKYSISLPKMGQIDDTTPPVAPTGVTGTCNNSGMVTISWSPNTEEDLKGYRVYTSDQNTVDSAFVQITSTPVTDTFFRFQVELNTLTEHMYFFVRALDARENTSLHSTHIDLLRPDQVAPSAPAITKVLPRSEAVELQISKSSSSDVVKYEFQKRWEGSPEWQVLAEFPFHHTPDAYVDSLSYLDPVLRRRWYHYRVVAFDDAGLAVSSQMVRAKPLDQGIRGPIQNLVAQLLNGPPKTVRLTWNYPVDVDLAGFQIYRAIDNSQMRSFKFLPINSFASTPGTYLYQDTDTNLKNVPQVGVFVQVAAPGQGGPVAITPNVVNKPANIAPNAFITLKYQIVAVYYDGAQSNLSPIVQVQFQ